MKTTEQAMMLCYLSKRVDGKSDIGVVGVEIVADVDGQRRAVVAIRRVALIACCII